MNITSRLKQLILRTFFGSVIVANSLYAAIPPIVPPPPGGGSVNNNSGLCLSFPEVGNRNICVGQAFCAKVVANLCMGVDQCQAYTPTVNWGWELSPQISRSPNDLGHPDPDAVLISNVVTNMGTMSSDKFCYSFNTTNTQNNRWISFRVSATIIPAPGDTCTGHNEPFNVSAIGFIGGIHVHGGNETIQCTDPQTIAADLTSYINNAQSVIDLYNQTGGSFFGAIHLDAEHANGTLKLCTCCNGDTFEVITVNIDGSIAVEKTILGGKIPLVDITFKAHGKPIGKITGDVDYTVKATGNIGVHLLITRGPVPQQCRKPICDFLKLTLQPSVMLIAEGNGAVALQLLDNTVLSKMATASGTAVLGFKGGGSVSDCPPHGSLTPICAKATNLKINISVDGIPFYTKEFNWKGTCP